MKLSLTAAFMLLAAPSVSAFAPSCSRTTNTGLQMASADDSCEDRRSFVTKVSTNQNLVISMLLSFHV